MERTSSLVVLPSITQPSLGELVSGRNHKWSLWGLLKVEERLGRCCVVATVGTHLPSEAELHSPAGRLKFRHDLQAKLLKQGE